jgi:hypothetical protein
MRLGMHRNGFIHGLAHPHQVIGDKSPVASSRHQGRPE